jgi:hypothetical protein
VRSLVQQIQIGEAQILVWLNRTAIVSSVMPDAPPKPTVSVEPFVLSIAASAIKQHLRRNHTTEAEASLTQLSLWEFQAERLRLLRSRRQDHVVISCRASELDMDANSARRRFRPTSFCTRSAARMAIVWEIASLREGCRQKLRKFAQLASTARQT